MRALSVKWLEPSFAERAESPACIGQPQARLFTGFGSSLLSMLIRALTEALSEEITRDLGARTLRKMRYAKSFYYVAALILLPLSYSGLPG